MGDRASFDTSFLIDFQRERRRSRGRRPAHEYLRAHPAIEPAISTTVLGEFAEGFDTPTHPLVNWVRQAHRILPVDEGVALLYAAPARDLRARG